MNIEEPIRTVHSMGPEVHLADTDTGCVALFDTYAEAEEVAEHFRRRGQPADPECLGICHVVALHGVAPTEEDVFADRRKSRTSPVPHGIAPPSGDIVFERPWHER